MARTQMPVLKNRGLARVPKTELGDLTMTFIKKLYADEQGATAIEYGLIAALIAVAAITAMGSLGDELSTTFSTVATEMGDANTVA